MSDLTPPDTDLAIGESEVETTVNIANILNLVVATVVTLTDTDKNLVEGTVAREILVANVAKKIKEKMLTPEAK